MGRGAEGGCRGAHHNKAHRPGKSRWWAQNERAGPIASQRFESEFHNCLALEVLVAVELIGCALRPCGSHLSTGDDARHLGV